MSDEAANPLAAVDGMIETLEAMTPTEQVAAIRRIIDRFDFCARCDKLCCSGWCDYQTPL